MGSVRPAVFLSGYIFPTESMPAVLQPISAIIPTTWMIDAARGVILRGAGWVELWQNAAIITLAAIKFKKRFS